MIQALKAERLKRKAHLPESLKGKDQSWYKPIVNPVSIGNNGLLASNFASSPGGGC